MMESRRARAIEMIEIIDFDVRCPSCGYNLRGLEVNHSCPECGTFTYQTLAMHSEVCSEAIAARIDAIVESMHRDAMKRSGAVEEALELIKAAIEGYEHSNAEQVCRSVVGIAIDFERDDALKFLHRLGIHRSEDIGRMVFALVECGLTEADQDDSPDDFANLGSMERLIEQSR